jgi:twitching motility protein PilT
MNALEQLLWSFDREDIEEISLTGGCPAKRVSGSIELSDDDVWSNEQLIASLTTLGGSRHVEALSETPRQWTAHVPGLGMVAITASQAKEDVVARFRLLRKEGKPSVPPPPPPPIADGPRGDVPPNGRVGFDTIKFGDRIPPMSERPSAPPAPPPPAPGAPLGVLPPPPAPPPPVPGAPLGVLPPPPAPPPPAPGAPLGVLPPPPAPAPPPLVAPPGTMMAPTPAVSPAPAHAPVTQTLPNAGRRRIDTPTAVTLVGQGPPPSIQVTIPSPPRSPSLDIEVSAPSVDPPKTPGRAKSIPPARLPSTPPPATPISVAPKAPVPAPPPPPPPNLRTLLANTRDAKASDLHIIAARPPLYRVLGGLRASGPVLSADTVDKVVRPLIPERLRDVFERDGSCDFAIDDAQHGRFRVNVVRQQSGLKACLRVISRELPTVESLALPDAIATAAKHRQGLIVFTGPTGHGKSTTLHALLDLLNRTTSHHVVTIEDPVEHLHLKKQALMSQREVGTHTASYASALAAALREDPDIIVVGEVRDVDTVRMALSASDTGHLVLATMSTPSAGKTLDRLIGLFPPGDQPQARHTLASAVRLITSQRLVPAKDASRMHAAFEVLPGSFPLSGLIRDGKTFQIPSLSQRGKGLGIVRLDEALAKLVLDDKVTLEAAKPLSDTPQELEAIVKAPRPPSAMAR